MKFKYNTDKIILREFISKALLQWTAVKTYCWNVNKNYVWASFANLRRISNISF